MSGLLRCEFQALLFIIFKLHFCQYLKERILEFTFRLKCIHEFLCQRLSP